MRAQTEIPAEYKVSPLPTAADDDEIIARAMEILERRMHRPTSYLTSPQEARQYLTLRLAEKDHEEVGMLWLDAQLGLVGVEILATGTVTQCQIYAREVMKAALAANAVSCVIFHNHPSGRCEPSQADLMLTENLKRALQLLDITLLDHLIVAGAGNPYSFAEHGLL